MKARHDMYAHERGSVMVTVAFAILAMTGATGLAVDIGRAQLAQAKLSSALDAAGLAAGSNMNSTDVDAEVTKYLNVNFENYLGTTLTHVDATVNSTNTVITIEAQGTIDTSIMKYFGFDTVPISADTEITRATSGLELVMALDNTGSMNGTPLEELKSAASELVEILHGDDTASNLYIGLVPFAQAVNVGSSRTSFVDAANLASRNWGTTSWGGCVDARLSGGDTTDAPPSSQIFYAYYWPDDSNNDWISTRTRRGVTTYTYNISSSRGPNKGCSQPVLGMTSDKQDVLDAINDMVADGYTHVNLGAVWAWRMISPRWRGLWGGEMDTNSLPLDYNTPRMNKAVILMTDGENTLNNSVRTAYWYPSDGRLGTTSTSAGVTELNNRLSSVCSSMKSNNIIVYTIAFGNPGSTIENLLRNCATQPDYYFDSPSGSELSEAFRQIGDSLSSLRVSR